jgi:hypothetical protein
MVITVGVVLKFPTNWLQYNICLKSTDMVHERHTGDVIHPVLWEVRSG